MNDGAEESISNYRSINGRKRKPLPFTSAKHHRISLSQEISSLVMG
jgi:hypothetical protein